MPDPTPEVPLAGRRPDLDVPATECRLVVRAEDIPVDTTSADVAPPAVPVGQDRAVRALELGLRLRRPGYHVAVTGPVGTGRRSTVRTMLADLAAALPVPPDRAYVRRFADPDRPRLLTLPPGTAAGFAAQIDALRDALLGRVPTLVEDPELDRRREALQQRYGRDEARLIEALRARLKADGFALVPVAIGPGAMAPEVAPLRDGTPVPLSELEGTMPPEVVADLSRRLVAHQEDVRDHFRGARARQRAFVAEITELVADAATALVEEELRTIEPPGEDGDVRAFLDDVRADAVAAIVEVIGPGPGTLDGFVERVDGYRVNVVADRADLTGAPVVEEAFPTAQNLAGVIERVQDGPLSWRADASTIRAGSLLRADGGFLMIPVAELLSEPGAWVGLRTTLKNGVLEVGSAGPGVLGLPRSLEPDPVAVDLKVVLVGEPWTFDVLAAGDPEFLRLFGVRAEFSPDMRRVPEAVGRYAAFVAGLSAREGLLPADAGAIGALVEEGVRLAGRRSRVSAQFSRIADLLREACFVAEGRGAAAIGRGDVEEALARREYRQGAVAERIQEFLEEGLLIVATDGRSAGEVNGLSVLDLGYQAFGKPTRITASVAPGRAGVISIEREARLSGGVYDKGVLIIGGWLRRRYADLGPLSLTASLTFEQSYAGVDGDSASIAEVIALVSELSGIPVDQALAVTGSINQHGEAQPVGAVNEKVTAFHALCRARGLEGGHGVVLPHRNLGDLMLAEELVADVAAGRFHLRAVHTVEDALEVALDAPIAVIDAAVRDRLAGFAEALVRAAPAPPPGVPPPGVPPPAPAAPAGGAAEAGPRP